MPFIGPNFAQNVLYYFIERQPTQKRLIFQITFITIFLNNASVHLSISLLIVIINGYQ